MAALRLATPASEGDIAQARRMAALLVDGLLHRAGAPAPRVSVESRERGEAGGR